MRVYRGGLLVTTSSQWLSGSSEQVCVVAYGLRTAVSVSVQLRQTRQRRNDTSPAIYSQASLVLPPGESYMFDHLQAHGLARHRSALLARDEFVRTNRRAIAMMFVRLSVRPSVCSVTVCLGRACIVIIYGALWQRRFKVMVG